ncbi:hypothetical protein I3843_12G012500 [Carya illinoinensis]|nr:hypothetical protein I3843_12G012500 [Carya illinoinensis]
MQFSFVFIFLTSFPPSLPSLHCSFFLNNCCLLFILDTPFLGSSCYLFAFSSDL